MKHYIPLIALIGCVQATVSDQITKTTEVVVKNPYSSYTTGYSLPPTTLPTQSVPVDISDTLSKIGQVGTLSFTVDQNTLHSNTGDFSFVDELKITVKPDSKNQSALPELTVIDFLPTPDQMASSDVDVPVLSDGATLLQYFSSGGLDMTFTFTVSGQVPAQLDVVNSITADVSVAVSKSVSDL